MNLIQRGIFNLFQEARLNMLRFPSPCVITHFITDVTSGFMSSPFPV